ncbi:MAG TPA: DUF2752 domain-containing protein [Mobilitalea sp.]|nr:DUF2752 domain-containing protein [Mobilitalea sp.]
MIRRTRYQIITLTIPLFAVLVYLLKNEFLTFLTLLPACPFYKLLHFYCPACGNTRSVKALLRGDLLSSLRYNIVPVIVLIFSLCAYIELAAYSFGKPVHIISRKRSFYIIGLILIMIYVILRNFIPFLAPSYS